MVLAAVRDDTYNVVLLLHIAAVLVGFAPAFVHPLLTAQTKREGGEALSKVMQHMVGNSRRLYFPAIIAAGLFGIVLILLSEDAWSFSDTWISLAFLAWIALCGVVSAMIIPGERKVAAGDLAAERQMALGGQIATVLLLVLLYLMLWKPGA